ncbi:MAG TPA: DUF4394 domain-containing protein [Blastocatellia bacterium]|nr:DUF4394 domain-containing protein [Blastocatellia bacterium]
MKKAGLVFLIGLLLAVAIPYGSFGQIAPLPVLGPCGERIFALTTDTNLISFSSDSPGILISSVSVTGLAPGESLLGIDFRPAVREMWALSDQNRLYIVDSNTGFARITSMPFPAAIGATLGFDFNPVADRLRVVTESDQNLRINVVSGATTVDGTLAYAASDVNAAANPNIVGSAYSNSFAGAPATTLYGIDSNLDTLVVQNPPNNGSLNTIGRLGVDTSNLTGFDIAANSTRAFASLTSPGGTTSSLYTVNLLNGAATLVGVIGGGQTVRDIAVSPRRPVTAYAVTLSNWLVSFNPDRPDVITSRVRIKGLQAGESIVGIDFRPANGRLYALGSSSRIYTINLNNGRVTPRPVAPFSTGLTGSSFGFDFNPVPDRIRVVSDFDQDLRLNPDTGEIAAIDGTLAFVSGDTNANRNPNIAASAYSSNFAGTPVTTLYEIDSDLDVLVIQTPPNNGTLNTIGPLGVDATAVAGFDIFGCDVSGYAALAGSGASASQLYRIDLATGRATLIGEIGGGEVVRGLALR